jgi:hypothetical protein
MSRNKNAVLRKANDMKLPQYLIDALYQFSKESIDEQEEFDRIHEEELAASEIK